MTVNQSRIEFAKRVTEVFPLVPLPNGPFARRDRIAHSFQGLRWDQVEPATLSLFCYELHDLYPHVYRYFLPAFLTGMLLHEDEVGALVSVMTYSLIPPKQDELRYREFYAEVEELAGSQRRVIYELFANYSELFPDALWPDFTSKGSEELEKALEYWGEES